MAWLLHIVPAAIEEQPYIDVFLALIRPDKSFVAKDSECQASDLLGAA
jgi:hypothetical protein